MSDVHNQSANTALSYTEPQSNPHVVLVCIIVLAQTELAVLDCCHPHLRRMIAVYVSYVFVVLYVQY